MFPSNPCLFSNSCGRLDAILVVSVKDEVDITAGRYEAILPTTLAMKSATHPSVGQRIVQRRADPSVTVIPASPAFLRETSTWSSLLSIDFALQMHIPFSVNIAIGTAASS